MRSQFGKDYDAEVQIVNLIEVEKRAETWGNRIHSPFAAESDNISWKTVRYKPGAFSIPHYHAKSEAGYYVDFISEAGVKRELTAYIGWPISEAKVYKITEPTIILTPAHIPHTFENTGDGELFLLHTFSPPWFKDFGQSMDTYDLMTQTYFSDGDEYSKHARETTEKYPTFDALCEELKARGIY